MSRIESVLDKQLKIADTLLLRITAIPDGERSPILSGYIRYDESITRPLEKDVEAWQTDTTEFLRVLYGEDARQVLEFERCINDKSHYFKFREDIQSEVQDCMSKLSAFIKADAMKQELDDQPPKITSINKPPKVFISHKKEDKAYADALVNLINFIVGADGDKIFCSSVQGYGIKQSRNIMDELKTQFENYEIFMIIIHSPRYYGSAVCLNEMGAAWVMGTQFSSFLTTDCKTEHMRGVINKERIFIDPNDDPDMLETHLNDFKNDLSAFFVKAPIDENKWANARNRFVNEVSSLTYAPVAKADIDLFETWYLPAFEHIWGLLEIDNFHRWAYSCAIAGNTFLKASVYENLERVTNYIMSRPKHKDYASWDSLMHNLGLLVSDFEMVFSQHVEKFDDGRYVVERFYKRFNPNPNYERDLAAYNEHVMLVSDLLFELARLCNLILTRIRMLYPGYKQELGILHIDNRITASDLTYKEDEISDTPYPGLKEFIKVRMMRETHLGSNPNIDEGGYEAN